MSSEGKTRLTALDKIQPILRDHPDIWVGLILYLVTPCIGWYLVFTDLADGDVELGVSLLFWNIALQIFLMPFYLYLLAGRDH